MIGIFCVSFRKERRRPRRRLKTTMSDVAVIVDVAEGHAAAARDCMGPSLSPAGPAYFIESAIAFVAEKQMGSRYLTFLGTVSTSG